MTVASDTSSASFTCDGVTVAFPVAFRFLENSHLTVYKRDLAALSNTLLVLDSDYTVTGAGENEGGTVTITPALSSDYGIEIERNVPLTQETAFVANDPLPVNSLEGGLDKLTMIVQQLMSWLSRSLRLIVGDTDGSGRYDANNNRIINLASAVDATDAATLQDAADLINAATLTPGPLGSVIGDVVTPGSYRWFGGVIRQTSAGAGWNYIDDTGHHPVGMTGTITLNGDGSLSMPMSWTADHVGSVWTVVDESYAAAGLTVGASIARDEVVPFFYGPWQVRLNNLSAGWGNYLPGASTIDTTQALVDGTVTFTHPAMTHVDTNGPIVVIQRYSAGGNESFVCASVTKSGFKVQAQDRIAGLVSVSGGAFTVTHGLVTAPTCVWDAANNRITVTHATTPGATAPTVSPASGSYIPVIESAGTTTLRVALYDYTGTKYTGASAPNCAFYFTRAGFAPALWNASNKLWIARGISLLDADDIGGAGANIWFGGIHRA